MTDRPDAASRAESRDAPSGDETQSQTRARRSVSNRRREHLERRDIRRSWRAARHVDWGLVSMVAVLLCVAVFLFGWFARDRNTLAGLAWLPILLIIAVPVTSRLGREERAFDLGNVLLAALAIRLTAAYLRFELAVDANVYHDVGKELSGSFRAFDFTPDVGQELVGTGFIRYITGLVQVVTLDDKFATFLVFSFASFWGVVLFYRAFIAGLPEGDRYRYAKLLFFWPSLVFWPSSIGKEAWMILVLGIAALGASRLFTHQRGGLSILAVGLLGCAVVRPHVALIVIVAVFVAYLFRRETHGSTLRLIGKGVGIVALLVIGGVLAAQTTEFFDLESLQSGGVDQALESTEAQTSQDDAGFTAARVTTPLHLPYAAVTVLLRPLPHEAHNAESLFTAVESMVLVLIAALSIRRFTALPRLARQHAYVVFAMAYLGAFVFAFSVIGNFGILARQRTQALPLLFVLLALPAVVETARRSRRGRRGRVTRRDIAARRAEIA